MQKTLLTVAESAGVLGYSVQHTRLLIRRGDLPARKLGRDWVLVRDQLVDYVQVRSRGAGNAPKQAILALNLVQQPSVINVSSVPQLSPFRYPGGKTWLVPHVRKWLQSAHGHRSELIEPFAGGAIVGLTAVFEGLVQRATLVELDEDIAAVWETILNGQGMELAQRIREFVMTAENVKIIMERPVESVVDRAFLTILRNRVSRGGIIAPGAGIVKRGENGKGLASRWYPETLYKRISEIVTRKDRFLFVRADGMGVMRYNSERQDVAYFIDPPYTVAGRRLYRHNEIDHAALFAVASRLKGDVLITYDDSTQIRSLAKKHGFTLREVPMQTTHHSTKTELLIGRNLWWLGAG